MSNREKILVYIAVLLLVAFGFFTLTNSIQDKIDAVTAENESLQAQKDAIDLKLGMKESLAEALETNTSDFETIKESTQNHATDEETDMIFTNMANSNALFVEALAISNEVSVFDETEIDLSSISMKQVTLTLTGSIADFVNLVGDLNERNDILVTSLTQSLGEGESELTHTYRIGCVIFMEKE